MLQMGYIDIPFADWIALPQGKDWLFLFCDLNFSDDCQSLSWLSHWLVHSSDMKKSACLTILIVNVVYNFQQVKTKHNDVMLYLISLWRNRDKRYLTIINQAPSTII